MKDLILTAIIAVGLVFFTFMIHISRRSRNRIKERRGRIKNHWKDRME